MLSYSTLDAYINFLLQWSRCYAVVFSTRPKEGDYDVVAESSVEYFMGKAVLWPGQVYASTRARSCAALPAA
eukprot:6947444-Prymnesium_polylepis.1